MVGRPDQHVRTQVGSVGPDDRAVLDARGLKHSEIVANRIEDGTDEQRSEVTLDDRSVCQCQPDTESIEGSDGANSKKTHRTILFQWNDGFGRSAASSERPIHAQIIMMGRRRLPA